VKPGRCACLHDAIGAAVKLIENGLGLNAVNVFIAFWLRARLVLQCMNQRRAKQSFAA
jgi:hypothetical protein